MSQALWVSGLLIRYAPIMTTNIPITERIKSGSLLMVVPRMVPTIGVKYVGIMLRTAPVRFERVAKSTNAKPVPRTPNTASALNDASENVEWLNPQMPYGADITNATISTCNMRVPGV